jgi:hypothetical protein
MQAYCLADFFNLQLLRNARAPTYADIRDGLNDLVAASLAAISHADLHASDLLVRLYGGWYGDSLSDRVALRELTSAVIEGFSRHGPTRLRLQLADAPVWDPSVRLLRSVRRVAMKPAGVTVSTPSECPHNGACSLQDLSAWWKGKCPNRACRVKLVDVASANRQKMVDTLLTADALTIARDGLAEIFIIASDDDDLLPALLALTTSEMNVIHLRREASRDAYYDGILEMRGLLTHTW